MSIKQVTVFGGSGFVGRAIVRALAQEGYQVRVACAPHRTRRAGQDRGRCRPGHADARQPARCRRRWRAPSPAARRWSMPPAFPSSAAGRRYQTRPRRRRPGDRRGRQGRRRAAPGPYLGHRRRPSQFDEPLHPLQGRGRGRDRRGLPARHDPAAERGLRARGRDLQPHGADRRQGAVRAAWSATARPRSSRSIVGDVGRAVVAVLARPETAKSVFELGGPRVYTYRELARPRAARDRPPQADRRRAGRR